MNQNLSPSGLYLRFELVLPFEREAHVLVAVLRLGTDGEHLSLEPVRRGHAVDLVVGCLEIIVAPETDGPLLADVVPDRVVHVELLARLVIRVVVLRVDVVHELGRELKAAVAQIGHAEDGLEGPVVAPDVGQPVLVVGAEGM